MDSWWSVPANHGHFEPRLGIFISFAENKELYHFSQPVPRTLVVVQSILAGCVMRTAFPESLWRVFTLSTAPKVQLVFLLGKMIKALLPFSLSKMLSAKII